MSNINEHSKVVLRQMVPGDLPVLFLYQADEEAAHMAAFMGENWEDKDAYLAKWTTLLADETLNIRTIVFNNEVAGSISTWQLNGDLQISYWVGKPYWNQGVATNALLQFLAFIPERPLFGRAAFDNIGSLKVLTKCGFRKIYEDNYYSNVRQQEIVEIVLSLEA